MDAACTAHPSGRGARFRHLLARLARFPRPRMSLKVFVSSTRHDLDKECRPRVIEAVRGAEAVAVVMEDWPADYTPALELVKQKIDESTHYLGLFAYRRGWIPPGITVSITEAEFEHACARLRGRIAVYVPDEESDIAKTLLELAEQAQDKADLQAQKSFLERVMKAAVVERFHDVPNLSMRATRRVVLWNTDLLKLQLARETHTGPGEEDVILLGRDAQADCFRSRVVNRLATGAAPAAGALVSGPPGHGHPQLLLRLRRQFEAVSRRLHPIPIGCGPGWRTAGLDPLLGVLATELGVAALPSVAAAAAHVATQLEKKDLLLEVTRLQHFEGGVAGFVEQFWLPLVQALPARTPFSLLCLAAHEGRTPAAPAWDAAVQACDADPFDPGRLVALPALEPFTPEELTVLVRPYVEPERVDDTVAGLMADSNEGNPDLLYKALADPGYWLT
jgi:hypothetical protein